MIVERQNAVEGRRKVHIPLSIIKVLLQLEEGFDVQRGDAYILYASKFVLQFKPQMQAPPQAQHACLLCLGQGSNHL